MTVIIFLNGLLPEFVMVKAQILFDSKIPSLDNAFTRVLRIESSPNEASFTIFANEYAKFQNYQDSLQASSSSTPVAFTVAQDRVTKKIIGIGYKSRGLYLFDHQVSQAVACPVVPSPFEVHCRLGHPSLFVLKKLYPEFMSLSSLNCDS
ncbi:gag-pol polyprotein [Cucumis melo var. makuwa]|uniref:Gag-pol polyprotein n=1 Tax=Cucumis melo var. makuwa TaxID=1194695 RepID=A0A5D3C7Y4_CUCMM|nr:gag-pol polyprotein [Cucumis melo var. makuwa]TYK08077.1 gag-pol polyprotein [Cucumis melo var. makuwa]